MSVICVSSLKGGVGKTSLAVNLAAAFAHRGCITLVIDLDPSCHASRLFRSGDKEGIFPKHSPIAQKFLGKEAESDKTFAELLEEGDDSSFVIPVRNSLELLPATGELRYFIPAHGARHFIKKFPALISNLRNHFDHIVIDTPPDYNVLTRVPMALSDLVLVPVDTSEMGVHSAEELLRSGQNLRKPVWALVRTMVNSRAQRTKVLSHARLGANLIMRNRNLDDGSGYHDPHDQSVFRQQSGYSQQGYGQAEYDNHGGPQFNGNSNGSGSYNGTNEGNGSARNNLRENGMASRRASSSIGDVGNNSEFLQLLKGWRSAQGVEDGVPTFDELDSSKRTVFLLDACTYRSEAQNQLSFLGKTAFDLKKTSSLSRQYLAVAKEVEEILAGIEDGAEGLTESLADNVSERMVLVPNDRPTGNHGFI